MCSGLVFHDEAVIAFLTPVVVDSPIAAPRGRVTQPIHDFVAAAHEHGVQVRLVPTALVRPALRLLHHFVRAADMCFWVKDFITAAAQQIVLVWTKQGANGVALELGPVSAAFVGPRTDHGVLSATLLIKLVASGSGQNTVMATHRVNRIICSVVTASCVDAVDLWNNITGRAA